MSYVVYILFSERLGRCYTGHTNDIEKRLETHNQGGKKYTTKSIPWKFIRSYEFQSISEAVNLEHRIKKRGIKRFLEEN